MWKYAILSKFRYVAYFPRSHCFLVLQEKRPQREELPVQSFSLCFYSFALFTSLHVAGHKEYNQG